MKTFDNHMRESISNDKTLKRWYLRRLIKELASPGKRESALRRAENLFGVSTTAELQALLGAMPQPRTINKRGKRRNRPSVKPESWNGQSVQRQEAASRDLPS